MRRSSEQAERRPIPGYRGYKAGSDGRIYGRSGRVLSNRMTSRGRPQVGLLTDRKPKQTVQRVSRLVLLAFRGPCPLGMEASHLDGDVRNNRLDNLVWETHRENVARKVRHGTQTRGEAHHHSKMTERDVIELRRLAAAGTTYNELAERYGVTDQAIRYAAIGHPWGHVSGAIARPGVAQGARRGHAKLSDDSVREMRRLRSTTGATYAALGERFGVSLSAARAVVLGHTWTHVV